MDEFDELGESPNHREPRSDPFRWLDVAAAIGIVLGLLLIYAAPYLSIPIAIIAVRLWSSDRISSLQCFALCVLSVVIAFVSFSGLGHQGGAAVPGVKPGVVTVPRNLR